MRKEQLVALIAEQTGMTHAQVLDVLEVFMKIVQTQVNDGVAVTLRGFGTFILKRRGRKKARNIRKGEFIEVPPRDAPVFVPAADWVKELKQRG